MPIDTTGWTAADLEAALAQLTAELRDRRQAEQDDQAATLRGGMPDHIETRTDLPWLSTLPGTPA